MSNHKQHYPQYLTPCHFCGGNNVQMNAALVRLPDTGMMSGSFDLECTDCGFMTKPYQYPDIAAHAWNMAAKLAIHDLTAEVATMTDKTDE